MRKEFITGGTKIEAETLCPWACEIVEVEGGWMAFESSGDYQAWCNQK